MARFGVRSGSVRFARMHGNLANSRFERTGANGSERPRALAMQKVVGSSPIIRSTRPCKSGGAVVRAVNGTTRVARFAFADTGEDVPSRLDAVEPVGSAVGALGTKVPEIRRIRTQRLLTMDGRRAW